MLSLAKMYDAYADMHAYDAMTRILSYTYALTIAAHHSMNTASNTIYDDIFISSLDCLRFRLISAFLH